VWAERLSDRVAWHGEGPVWWPEWGLRMVDGYAGDVLGIDVRSGRECSRLRVGGYAGAFRPRAGGGLVVGIERGFALVSPHGDVQHLPPVWSDTGLRMNEGACDWNGDFFCGRLREDPPREGHGSLYRLRSLEGECEEVLAGLAVPNGLVFDRSARLAYHIDTPTRLIHCYDYDGTALAEPRVSVDLSGVDGYPDGLTMDRDGHLWVALSGGSAVHCYAPGSDRILERVRVPGAANTTAVTFGGEDLGTLFITTSQQGPAPGPAAGSVFAVRPGVIGVLPWACAL
jgi:sugar lactone lactonase YvrE